VRGNPVVTRNAFQRLYGHGRFVRSYPIEGSKENLVRYNFFDDPANDGDDAIFGLTKPLMELVNVSKSAALGYGSERRVVVAAWSGGEFQKHDRPPLETRPRTV